MNKRFLSLTCLMLVLLSACVDDPELSEQGEVMLKLRVSFANPQLSTRAIEDYYFHNEYTVSRLDVYFFDVETKKFFTKAVITNLTKDDSTYDTEYDITYQFDNIRIRAGVYDIFTIANYDYAPDKVADETELLDRIDSLTYREGIEASIPATGPVMTNRATSMLAVDLIPMINKTYILNIELERVMAKLQIGVSQNTFPLMHEGRKYADINITNYKLLNMNRQYYLFQHTDILSELTGEMPGRFTMPDNYGDYSEQDEQYVIDPYFYQKQDDATEASVFGQYYKSWFGNFTTEDFASMPAADNYGYAYILENTAFKTSQKNGYSPGIAFKGAVSPVFVYLYDTNLRTLKEEYRPEYWPKTIYLYQFNFYGSIKAINMASGLSLDELVTYTDAELKPYGIKQCKFNMGVYETFYTYWIHHRNDTDIAMGPMEYGIVRNHFYRMLITGVSGIGNSAITPNIMRDNDANSYTDVVIN
ncbi:MAG: Mfa1 family fimbria major subunit [Bacteroidaceae bacterium]|nr:Mfa1 family fimbria major subunit [Bacteroidaceae bacterium]